MLLVVLRLIGRLGGLLVFLVDWVLGYLAIEWDYGLPAAAKTYTFIFYPAQRGRSSAWIVSVDAVVFFRFL